MAEWLDDVAPCGLNVRFAAHTSLRPGELEALRIRDITSFAGTLQCATGHSASPAKA